MTHPERHFQPEAYYRHMAMEEDGGVAAWAEEVAAMSAMAGLFQSFSDPSRLVILRHLQFGEHRVVDLTAHLGLSQSTVSKHLVSLKEAGLVVSRPEGRASMYSLQHPEGLVELFAAVEAFLKLRSDAR